MSNVILAENEAIKELMDGSYFYEDRRIRNTRKIKSCDICYKNIPTGAGHLALKLFNGEFYDCNVCSSCEVEYKDELMSLRAGNYDNY